jgi:hypothetical protein
MAASTGTAVTIGSVIMADAFPAQQPAAAHGPAAPALPGAVPDLAVQAGRAVATWLALVDSSFGGVYSMYSCLADELEVGKRAAEVLPWLLVAACGCAAALGAGAGADASDCCAPPRSCWVESHTSVTDRMPTCVVQMCLAHMRGWPLRLAAACLLRPPRFDLRLTGCLHLPLVRAGLQVLDALGIWRHLARVRSRDDLQLQVTRLHAEFDVRCVAHHHDVMFI